VERIIDSDGNVIKECGNEIKRQVISRSVADTVAAILEEGVSGDGGAKNAGVSGYKIAAKTGTSQKFDVLDENGNSYLRISSTVAFSISEEKDIAVIIVADEPTSAVKYGSVVAAPYVSAFLSKALPYLGFESTSPQSTLTVANYVGMNVSDACAAIKKSGLNYEVLGSGDIVISQTPTVSDCISNGGKILLYTYGADTEHVIVPDVRGIDAAQANEILTYCGLNIKITTIYDNSTGAVVSLQSIPPGTVVPRNTVIEISILHLDFED
jgi:stage V sporulation protein D (sporulation-specific penicillin-binding protein)